MSALCSLLFILSCTQLKGLGDSGIINVSSCLILYLRRDTARLFQLACHQCYAALPLGRYSSHYFVAPLISAANFDPHFSFNHSCQSATGFHPQTTTRPRHLTLLPRRSTLRNDLRDRKGEAMSHQSDIAMFFSATSPSVPAMSIIRTACTPCASVTATDFPGL